jgi:hypothetical protein
MHDWIRECWWWQTIFATTGFSFRMEFSFEIKKKEGTHILCFPFNQNAGERVMRFFILFSHSSIVFNQITAPSFFFFFFSTQYKWKWCRWWMSASLLLMLPHPTRQQQQLCYVSIISNRRIYFYSCYVEPFSGATISHLIGSEKKNSFFYYYYYFPVFVCSPLRRCKGGFAF